MSEKIPRRTFLKKMRNFTLTSLLTGFAGFYYAKYIEPHWLETSNHVIEHPLIPLSFNQFKIAQFSDTHLGYHFHLSHLERVIRKIMEEKPDLIIFSGDLIDNPKSYTFVDETIQLLSHLSAPFGKIAVYGNHDHGGYGTNKYQYIMESSQFTLLKNESVKLAKGNDYINLVGVDDCMLGKPNIPQGLKKTTPNTFTLLISHAPDLADIARTYPIHFQLSGHSHGGQVQIPFLGPIITPPYGQKYYEGFYEISKDLTLYVNRGLGTTRLPFRLFSRPELTFFTLRPIETKK